MIAPSNPQPEALVSVDLGLGVLVRCTPRLRAFENKQGGWTLVTRRWEELHLSGNVALFVWDRLQAEALRPCDLVEELAQAFPGVPRRTLVEDVLSFLTALREAGFVESFVRAGRSQPLPSRS